MYVWIILAVGPNVSCMTLYVILISSRCSGPDEHDKYKIEFSRNLTYAAKNLSTANALGSNWKIHYTEIYSTFFRIIRLKYLQPMHMILMEIWKCIR